jgi:hypothetical protein
MANFDSIKRRERARFYLSFVTTETASLRMIGLWMPRRAELVLGEGWKTLKQRLATDWPTQN